MKEDGERFLQYKIAHRLHKGRREFLKGCSTHDFFDWVCYFDEEKNHHQPVYWYLAQIAYVMIRMFCDEKTAKKLDIKDFLLEFKSIDPNEKPSDLDIDERSELAMQKWQGIVGAAFAKTEKQRAREVQRRAVEAKMPEPAEEQRESMSKRRQKMLEQQRKG